MIDWEDDQFDPAYWEEKCRLEGDEELDFNRGQHQLEESIDDDASTPHFVD